MQYKKAVDALYETVFEPDSWRLAAVQCAKLVSGTTFFLQVADPAAGLVDVISGHGLEGLGIPAYEAYYHKVDIWRDALQARAKDSVHLYHQIVRQTDFENSEAFNDWVKPGVGYDVFWGLGSCLRLPGGQVSFLASHRSERQGEMTDADRATFQRLVLHVRRVLRMRSLVGGLNQRIKGLEALCDRAACAMALVDRRSRLVYANRQASHLLRQADGLRLRRDGTVAARETVETAALQAAVTAACSAGLSRDDANEARFKVTRAGGAHPLIVSVCPIPGDLPLGGRSHAIVTAEDVTAAAVPAPEKIRLAFGLTAAEARLAQQIAAGKPLREAAEAAGVTYETARSRLKSIFHKTHTTRQAQLAALLAGITEGS